MNVTFCYTYRDVLSYLKTYRIELNLIATLCINVEIKIEYKINIEHNPTVYNWLQYLI